MNQIYFSLQVRCSQERHLSIKFISITRGEQLSPIRGSDGLSPLAVEEFNSLNPDRHVIAVDTADPTKLLARLSLWWRRVPGIPGKRLGVIGHYAAGKDQIGKSILEHAVTLLAEQGCTLAIGPMDRDTWHRYRLVTDCGDAPPFFMEPRNPVDWPNHFKGAGFTELATYQSAIDTDLDFIDPRINALEQRFKSQGLRVRSLDPQQFDRELNAIYRLTVQAFSDSYLYTPILESEFKQLYKSIGHLITPQLVLIAERDNEPIGYIFGMPDLEQAQPGHKADTAIIKTIGVISDRTVAGCGAYLIHLWRQEARRLGFARIIHALMHDENHKILNVSNRYAQTFRRYTLFGHVIEP